MIIESFLTNLKTGMKLDNAGCHLVLKLCMKLKIGLYVPGITNMENRLSVLKD